MDHQIYDSRKGELFCLNCGKRQKLPDWRTLRVRELGASCAEFRLRHAECRPRALSLRNPWAWLMLRPDLSGEARAAAQAAGLLKDVENRDFNCYFRGRVLVHASGTMTRGDYEAAGLIAGTLDIELPPFEELQRGGIVGEFVIDSVVTESTSPWFFGKYGFVVSKAKALPFVACKARSQRWWYPDAETLAAIDAGLEAVAK